MPNFPRKLLGQVKFPEGGNNLRACMLEVSQVRITCSDVQFVAMACHDNHTTSYYNNYLDHNIINTIVSKSITGIKFNYLCSLQHCFLIQQAY